MASPLFTSTTRHQGLGIAILRIITGMVFTAHGYQKVFVYGMAGVTGAFTKMGAPLPTVTGPLIACLEFFGGIALIIGLLTRLVAFAFVFDMLGAMMIVHLANGFFLPAGYEFVLLLLAASLALMFGGPGSLAIDSVIASKSTSSNR
ncbi:MAG: DoxX family protein [Gemmatimonadota bacterium]|nr:DoxX family protein [Gemmatimonadota bacterium]